VEPNDAPSALTVLSEDERLFRDSVARFADARIRPLVREMDERAAIPQDLVEGLFDLGVMGIEVPEALGGAGARFFHAILAVEEISAVDPAVAVLVDIHNTLVVKALLRWGSAAQRERYLPALATHTVGAYALSEAGAGSDAFSLAARAVADGEGYVLNGRKLWISNAGEAGLFIVFANADPQAGHRGITAFLVDRGTPGFTVGRKEDKVGVRASSTCELLLEDCRLPASQVLGRPGQGYTIAIELLNEGRIGIGAQMTGLARGAYRHAIQYARERRQFGRPIAEFQLVRAQLARMAADIEAARLLVYNAARLCEAGRPFVTESAISKLFAAEAAERVTSAAINVYGGCGFVRDFPVEKYWRDAKIGQIYEGTTNIQLLTIAKQLLGERR